MTKILSKEELDDRLCRYCQCTDLGEIEVNTGPWNLCEGAHCDSAYENYLENLEEEVN